MAAYKAQMAAHKVQIAAYKAQFVNDQFSPP